MWDAAYHLADGYSIRDLLLEHIPLQEKLLAMSKFYTWYPPLFKWVHCAFLLMPIPNGLADRMPALLFYAIGMFALYRLALLLCKDSVVATVAVGIYSMIPIVYTCTHSRGLLDTPLTSMCTLAIWSLARTNLQPTRANSVVTGILVALACLTKQTGPLYMAPPIALVITRRLWLKDYAALKTLACGLTLGAAIYLSWLIPNLFGIHRELSENLDYYSYMGSGLQLWLKQFHFYVIDKAPKCLSAPLALVFVLSLFNLRIQRQLWLPASTLIGLLVLCTFHWDAYTFRYALPIVSYISLSSAAFLVDLWRSRRVVFRVFDIAIAAYLFALYLVLNFTPYPVPRNPIANLLGLDFVAYGCVCPGTFPAFPWVENSPGYEWLVDHFATQKATGRADLLLGDNRTLFAFSEVMQAVTAEKLPRPITVLVNRDVIYFSIAYLARQRKLPVVFAVLDTPGLKGPLPSRSFYWSPDWYIAQKKDPHEPPQQFMTNADVDNCKMLHLRFPQSNFIKVGECEVYDSWKFPPTKCTWVLYRNHSL